MVTFTFRTKGIDSTMINLAYKIASAIKRANPGQTSSVAVMQYSLIILLNTLSIIASALLIGWAMGSFLQTLLALCSLMLLRMLSGGSHLKTARGCYIVSVALCVGIPLLPAVGDGNIWVMTVFSATVMLIFAPNPDRNARLQQEWLPYLKILSILLVCSNFALESQIMGWAFFIQALTTIPWRGKRT